MGVKLSSRQKRLQCSQESCDNMFVLKRFISIDGGPSDETVLIFDTTVDNVRDKWNRHVDKVIDNNGERYAPPKMESNSDVCVRSYTGGGCYASHRFEIVQWIDACF